MRLFFFKLFVNYCYSNVNVLLGFGLLKFLKRIPVTKRNVKNTLGQLEMTFDFKTFLLPLVYKKIKWVLGLKCQRTVDFNQLYHHKTLF